MPEDGFPTRTIVQAVPHNGRIRVPMPCCPGPQDGQLLPTTIPAEPLYAGMLVQCRRCKFAWLLKQIEGWSFYLEWPFLEG